MNLTALIPLPYRLLALAALAIALMGFGWVKGAQHEQRKYEAIFAEAIARKRYWDPVRCDELPEAIRYAMFDCAYNSGPGQAVKFLQRAVGTNPDGVIGAVTLAAADKASLATLVGLRLDFVTSLPTWAAFGKGWVRRCSSILQET